MLLRVGADQALSGVADGDGRRRRRGPRHGAPARHQELRTVQPVPPERLQAIADAWQRDRCTVLAVLLRPVQRQRWRPHVRRPLPGLPSRHCPEQRRQRRDTGAVRNAAPRQRVTGRPW